MVNNYLITGPVTQTEITNILDKLGKISDSGGHSIFIGQVREDKINGKKVLAIEYSTYEGMVKVEAEKIIHSMFLEFGDVKSIEIIHSTGIVKAGEISLFVLVSAIHRHQAIQACSKTVELVKERLPVWKKEIFDDDSYEWKQNIDG